MSVSPVARKLNASLPELKFQVSVFVVCVPLRIAVGVTVKKLRNIALVRLPGTLLAPVPLTATALYYESIRALAGIAGHLGRAEDAVRYDKEAGKIASAFNRKFFDPATGTYATGSQTALALPLVLDLVEPGRRAAAIGPALRP